MNIKCIIIAVLLSSIFVASSNYAQNRIGYVISGQIKGLRDGTTIRLESNQGVETKSIAKNEQFNFSGSVEVEGTPHLLFIGSVGESKEILLSNSSELVITGTLSEWPRCHLKETGSPGSYLDFQNRVQEPFSSAYVKYLDLIKSLTGKNEPEKRQEALKRSVRIDSLKMALAKEIYDTATQTYIKEVYLWIGMYPDSYYSPFLISFWWPKMDRKNAYHRLTEKAQYSFYGRLLNEQIKTIK